MGSSEKEALTAACIRFFDEPSRTDADRLALLTALLERCSADQWHVLDSCFKSLQLDLQLLSSPPRPPKPAALQTPAASKQRKSLTPRSALRELAPEAQTLRTTFPPPAHSVSDSRAPASSRSNQRVGKVVSFEAFAFDVGNSGGGASPSPRERKLSILQSGIGDRRSSLLPILSASSVASAERRSSMSIQFAVPPVVAVPSDAGSTDSSTDSSQERSFRAITREPAKPEPSKGILRQSLVSLSLDLYRSPRSGLSSFFNLSSSADSTSNYQHPHSSLKSILTYAGVDSARASQSKLSMCSLPASLSLQQTGRARMRRPSVIPTTSTSGLGATVSRWHRLPNARMNSSTGLQQQLIAKRKKRSDKVVSLRAELLVSAIQEKATRGWAQSEVLTLLVSLVKRAPVATCIALIDYVRPRIATRSHVSRLSDDNLLTIFEMLSVDDLLACSQVCRRWKYLCSKDHLWVHKCRQIVFARALPAPALIDELQGRLLLDRVPRETVSLPLALGTARALGLKSEHTDSLLAALGLELPPVPAPKAGVRGRKLLSAVRELSAEYAVDAGGSGSSSTDSESHSDPEEYDSGPHMQPVRQTRVRIQESPSVYRRRHYHRRNRQRRRPRSPPVLPVQWMHLCLSLRELDFTVKAAEPYSKSARSARRRTEEGPVEGREVDNQEYNESGEDSSPCPEGPDMTSNCRRSSLEPELAQLDTELGNWALVAERAERQQQIEGVMDDEIDLRLTQIAQQSSLRDHDDVPAKKLKSKKKKTESKEEIQSDAIDSEGHFKMPDRFIDRRPLMKDLIGKMQRAQDHDDAAIDQQIGTPFVGSRSIKQTKPNLDPFDVCMILQGHLTAVTAVLSGRLRVVSGDREGNVRLWDRMTGETFHKLIGHRGPVTALAFSTNQPSKSQQAQPLVVMTKNGVQKDVQEVDLLATGGWDCSVVLWRVDTLSEFRAVRAFRGGDGGHGDRITCLNFYENLLLSSSLDGSVHVFDARANPPFLLRTIAHPVYPSAPAGGIVRFAVLREASSSPKHNGVTHSPSRRRRTLSRLARLATAHVDRIIRVVDLETLTPYVLATAGPQSESITALVALDYERLVSSSTGGNVAVWRLPVISSRSKSDSRNETQPGSNTANGNESVPRAVALGGREWPLCSGVRILDLALAHEAGRAPRLFAACRDGCVREASIDLLQETLRVVRILRGHKGPITALGLFGGTTYSGVGVECQLISASEDGFVRIWRSATREEMYSGDFEEPSPLSNKDKKARTAAGRRRFGQMLRVQAQCIEAEKAEEQIKSYRKEA